MRRILLFYAVLLIHTLNYSQDKVYEKVKYPEGYTATLNIEYTQIENWKGRIDIYANKKVTKPTPVVLNIHGGGWRNGVKESQKGFRSFFKRGYAVANVEYRLSHQGSAPAAIEDIRCAIIYLHKNAKKLNIDPNKIVIMGGSAGGHLALMGGLLENNRRFDTHCSYKGEIKIAAIIDRYGVSDLSPFKKWKSAKLWLGGNFLNEEFTKSVSPINYVNKNNPPVFMIHGDQDTTVPYEQSVLLLKKLKSVGVKSELHTVKGAGHGKFSKEEKRGYRLKMFAFLESIGL